MKLPQLILILFTSCVLAAAADETSALATLAKSDASLHDKAMACDELGRSGSAKAVPVLAKLLADEKLHDYARDGLERIPGKEAEKALLAALDTVKGSLRTGVIITLGDRRVNTAVPALAKIAQGKGAAAEAALSSLGKIADTESAVVILAALHTASDAKVKAAARHAALYAAQRAEKDGNKDLAAKLRKVAGK